MYFVTFGRFIFFIVIFTIMPLYSHADEFKTSQPKFGKSKLEEYNRRKMLYQYYRL